MTFIELMINFIIPALFAVVTYYIVPLIKTKKLYEYIKICVRAAEQIYDDHMGKDKFAFVSDWVKSKFKISDDDLEKLIEAAVFEMKKIKLDKNAV